MSTILSDFPDAISQVATTKFASSARMTMSQSQLNSAEENGAMAQGNLHTFHRKVLEATMRDRQAKIRAHVHHGGPRIGLGRRHQMSQWLLKRRRHCPTSSGRGSHQIILITCRQVITTPTICPKAIRVITTQACHRIPLLLLDACVLVGDSLVSVE